MAQCLINNTGNKGANGVMIKILNFFVSKGFTPTMACAIAGNVQKESSYIPTNVNEIGCVGLFQWCYSRRDKIKAKYGDPGWKNIDNQLEFIWGELNGSWGYTEYKKVKEYFLANTNRTLSEYCYYWLRWMETPSLNENELRTKYLPERMTEANKAAALYNQMNKGECTVNSDSSDDDSGFSCEMSEEAVSDVNFVDTSVSTTADTQGTDSSGETSNNKVDFNTKPLFIADEIGSAILNGFEDINEFANVYTFAPKYTYEEILNRLKVLFSNKNYKPKYVVVFLAGAKLKWGDSTKKRKQECDKFLMQSQDHTGYTNFFWFSSVSPVMNVVNATTPSEKNQVGYILNQAASGRGSNGAYKGHFKYVPLAARQGWLLDDKLGYRTYKNKTYVINAKGAQMLRMAIKEEMKFFKTGRLD